jgi:predicted Zn-dependent protease with MMP-like domain
MGSFQDARRPLERAVAMEPESGHAVYHLGLTLERVAEGREESERCFERADALDPEHYPMPIQIDEARFERAAEEALRNLPRSIRDYVEGVPVLVEEFPSTELVSNENVSPQILGIFIGVPRTEASVSQPHTDLDRVILFKRNLERMCRNEGELIEQIQITVKHEIGHYLGLSEDDLERLGLG